jgi:hypothetical protein
MRAGCVAVWISFSLRMATCGYAKFQPSNHHAMSMAVELATVEQRQ